MKILVLCDYFHPGYLAGGPVQSLTAMIDSLGKELRFQVLTRDHDLGVRSTYPTAIRGRWQRVGLAEVRYLSTRERQLWGLRRLIREAAADVLYLNSFFSPAFSAPTLLLRRIGALPRVPVVLAPRGEFAPGALALKPTKKAVYLNAVRRLQLCKGIVWQAASLHEAEHIRAHFDAATVRVAPNLSSRLADAEPARSRVPKARGTLRLVFIARIARNKGLHLALEALRSLRGSVEFNVFGPGEDGGYLAECQRLAGSLPPQVRVNFAGPLPHENVYAELRRSHLFILPTSGENFGHAIVEAFQAGCPVLISDRTPWRSLQEKQIGWDVPLGDQPQFAQILKACIEMDETEHAELSKRVEAFGMLLAGNQSSIDALRSLFRDVGSP